MVLQKINKQEFLTRDEVATEFRIPAATLAKWASVGGGPLFARLGRRVVYRRYDVEAWFSSNLIDLNERREGTEARRKARARSTGRRRGRPTKVEMIAQRHLKGTKK